MYIQSVYELKQKQVQINILLLCKVHIKLNEWVSDVVNAKQKYVCAGGKEHIFYPIYLSNNYYCAL